MKYNKIYLQIEFIEDDYWIITSSYPKGLNLSGKTITEALKKCESVLGFLLLFNHGNRSLAQALLGKEEVKRLEPELLENIKLRIKVKNLISNFPGNSEQLIIALTDLESRVDEKDKETLDRASRVIAILASSNELVEDSLKKEIKNWTI